MAPEVNLTYTTADDAVFERHKRSRFDGLYEKLVAEGKVDIKIEGKTLDEREQGTNELIARIRRSLTSRIRQKLDKSLSLRRSSDLAVLRVEITDRAVRTPSAPTQAHAPAPSPAPKAAPAPAPKSKPKR